MSVNDVHLGELGFSVNNDDDIEGRFMSAEAALSLLGVYPRKYWRNINQEIMQNDLTLNEKEEEASSYHVTLAWDTTREIDIQLDGCEV